MFFFVCPLARKPRRETLASNICLSADVSLGIGDVLFLFKVVKCSAHRAKLIARRGRKMPRRDGRSRLLSEEASPAAMELVARALDGTPTADEFSRPWVGMPDEFAADSARAAVAQRLQPGVGPSESLTLQLGRRPRRAPWGALGDHTDNTEPLRLRLSSGARYRRQHSLGLLVLCLIDRIY